MSSYQEHRDRFVASATRAGIAIHDARTLMRYAKTLDRLNEAACNGDYPCDNGEREVKPCTRCECLYAPAALDVRGVCQGCRVEDRVRALVAPYGVAVELGGDPRGHAIKLMLNDREVGVPVRS